MDTPGPSQIGGSAAWGGAVASPPTDTAAPDTGVAWGMSSGAASAPAAAESSTSASGGWGAPQTASTESAAPAAAAPSAWGPSTASAAPEPAHAIEREVAAPSPPQQDEAEEGRKSPTGGYDSGFETSSPESKPSIMRIEVGAAKRSEEDEWLAEILEPGRKKAGESKVEPTTAGSEYGGSGTVTPTAVGRSVEKLSLAEEEVQL